METPNQSNTTPQKLATKYIKILDKPREPNSGNQRVESKCTSLLMSEVPTFGSELPTCRKSRRLGQNFRRVRSPNSLSQNFQRKLSALPTPTGNELQVLK